MSAVPARGLGLRGRLLWGLALIAVAGMGLSGALALHFAQAASAEPIEGTARALARAAAELVAAGRDPARPLAEQSGRLAALAARLRDASGADEVALCDPSGRVIAASEPVLHGTRYREPEVALAAESGEAIERAGRGSLRVYHPVRAPGRSRADAVVRVRAPSGAARLRGPWGVLALLTAANGLVLLGAAAFVLTRYVVRPIARLSAGVRAVASGDLGRTVPEEGAGEVADLARGFNEMSRALAEQVRRLDEAREQLVRSEKLASVGRLAAGVAHEIGNPLGAIVGYLEVLRAGGAPEADARDLVERIARETRRIHEIVRQLLDYARPPRTPAGPADLALAIDAAVALVVPQRRFGAVRVERELPDGLPPVRADAGLVTQVFVNLLLNAADAMKGRGTVRVRAGAEDGRVRARVSDEGPGVPPEARDRIFDPFYTTKEPGEGTGLGLSISLSIVESLGGSLRLADSGPGATFVVELPRADAGGSPA